MTSPERTRVLYVINDLARAGAETQLVELARRLDRYTFEPQIVLLKSRNDFAVALEAASVPVVPLRRAGWWDLGVVSRLRSEVERVRPHVVHASLFLANLVSAVAVGRRPALRLILSQRCSYEATASAPWRTVARWSHRRADRVVLNSQAALDEEAAAGFPRDRLVHIPNGVALVEPPATSRADLGLPDVPLVACVGQLERIKGHHVLLAAWRGVHRHVPRAHLVLVGSGPRRRDLEEQARELGLETTVTFAGFRFPSVPWIEAADVCVQPSLTEGMPNAVLEAMALGRPVVASAVGGIPELVDDGRTGLLVPPDDPEALAARISLLLTDRALATRLGLAGRQRMADHFSFERVVAETEALYRSLASGRAGSAAASTAAPNSTGPIVTP